MRRNQNPFGGSFSFAIAGCTLAALISTATSALGDIREGLVSYWPLDEVVTLSDGFTLGTPDESTANHMSLSWTMSAANLVPGRHGQAMRFSNAELTYLNHYTPPGVDNGLPISRSRVFSILMWVKAVGEGQGDLRFFAEGSTTSNNPLFSIGTQSAAPNGRIRHYIRDLNNAVGVDAHTPSTPLDGEWSHYAWVEDNGQVTVYIDGEVDATYSYAPSQLLRADENTTLGGIFRAIDSHWFTGELDEVALWERALSEEEVREVMNDRIEVPVPVFAPTFLSDPVGNENLWPGDNHLLSADVIGTRPISLRWQRNGEDLQDANTRTLLLSEVGEAQVGDYTLIAENDGGARTSLVARVAITPPPAPDLTNNMVAYWPLDVLEGTKTPDIASGYDLEAVNMTGADVVPGRWGNAFRFEFARATMLQRINSPGEDLPIYQHPEFTISMWVNGAPNQTDLRIFSEGSTLNANQLFNIGTHNTGADGRLDSFIRNDTGATANHIYSEGTVFDDTWHHVVYVQREVAGQMVGRFFIDGVEDPIPLEPRRPLTANTTTVGGILRGVASHFFNGLIDDVALWNRALSAEEVALLSAEGTPTPPVQLQPLEVRLFLADFPAIRKGDTVPLRWDVSRDASISIDNGIGNVDSASEVGIGRVDVTLEESTTFTITITRGEESLTAQTTVYVVDEIANGWAVLDTFDRYAPGALRDTSWWIDLRLPGGSIVDDGENHLLEVLAGDAAVALPLRRKTVLEGQSRTLFFRMYVPDDLAVAYRHHIALTEKNIRWHGDLGANTGPWFGVFTTEGVVNLETSQFVGGTVEPLFATIEAGSIYNVWLDVKNEPAASFTGDLYSLYLQKVGDPGRQTVFVDYWSNRDPAGSIDLGPTMPDLDRVFITSNSATASFRFDDFYISTAGLLDTVPRAVGFVPIVGDIGGGDPSLASIALVEGEIEISWTTGTLQWSSSVDGPWEDVAGATSPYQAAAEGTARYYRIE